MTSKMASEKAAATRELQHTPIATTWYQESPGMSTTYSTRLADRAKKNRRRAVGAAENNAKAAEGRRQSNSFHARFLLSVLFSVLTACQNIKNRFQTTQPACSSLFVTVQSTAEYPKWSDAAQSTNMCQRRSLGQETMLPIRTDQK